MLGIVLGAWAAFGCATAGATTGSQTAAAPGQDDEPTRKEKRQQKKEKRTLGEKVAGRATEGAIEKSLETLDTPENRERLPRIVASPQMQEAAHDITANIVAGVFDGVDMARSKGQLPKMPSAGNIGRSIGRTIDHDITPATGRLVHNTIDSALAAATSDQNTGRIEALVQRMGVSVSKGIANALRDEVGPALAVTIERDILPAVGRGLQSPDVQDAIVASMLSLGVGTARGTQAGLAEADVKTGGRTTVGGTIAVGVMAASIVAVTFAVLFVVMTILMIRSSRRQREMMDQSRRREERLLAVLEGRAETHGEPITSPGLLG
jgi:hypothetical protein